MGNYKSLSNYKSPPPPTTTTTTTTMGNSFTNNISATWRIFVVPTVFCILNSFLQHCFVGVILKSQFKRVWTLLKLFLKVSVAKFLLWRISNKKISNCRSKLIMALNKGFLSIGDTLVILLYGLTIRWFENPTNMGKSYQNIDVACTWSSSSKSQCQFYTVVIAYPCR